MGTVARCFGPFRHSPDPCPRWACRPLIAGSVHLRSLEVSGDTRNALVVVGAMRLGCLDGWANRATARGPLLPGRLVVSPQADRPLGPRPSPGGERSQRHDRTVPCGGPSRAGHAGGPVASGGYGTPSAGGTPAGGERVARADTRGNRLLVRRHRATMRVMSSFPGVTVRPSATATDDTDDSLPRP